MRYGRLVQRLLQCKRNKYYIFWVYVFSLRYPACKAHAPYCRRRSVRMCNVFPNYLINGTIFEKNVTELKMCVLIFSTFVWNMSHSMKNPAICDEKCVLVCLQSTGDICQILMKLEFPRQIFGKCTNIMPSPQPIFFRSILILLFHLCLSKSPKNPLSLRFRQQSLSPILITCLVHLLVASITRTTFDTQ